MNMNINLIEKLFKKGNINMHLAFFVLTILFIFNIPLYSQPPISNEQETKRLERLISPFKDPITRYKLLQTPGLPPEKIRIYPEWQATEFLVLAYPFYTLFLEEINNMIIQVVRTVAEQTKILIIVDEDNLTSMNKLITLIREKGLRHFIEDGRICFLTARLDTQWIRDYGPLYGTNDCGKFYLVDTFYYDVRADTVRSNDDVLPSYLLDFLRNGNFDIQAIRPPILITLIFRQSDLLS
jgi:hypothetical protein